MLFVTYCGVRIALYLFWFLCIIQKKAFEEDRASWLKNQFLNMTPFTDRRRCSSSDGQSALSISKSGWFTQKPHVFPEWEQWEVVVHLNISLLEKIAVEHISCRRYNGMKGTLDIEMIIKKC